MEVLEELDALLIEEIDSISYCHLLCCQGRISMCGAYKPVRCDIPITNEAGYIDIVCPACNRITCPECLLELEKGCMVCHD